MSCSKSRKFSEIKWLSWLCVWELQHFILWFVSYHYYTKIHHVALLLFSISLKIFLNKFCTLNLQGWSLICYSAVELKAMYVPVVFAGVKWFRQMRHWMEAWCWEVESRLLTLSLQRCWLGTKIRIFLVQQPLSSSSTYVSNVVGCELFKIIWWVLGHFLLVSHM